MPLLASSQYIASLLNNSEKIKLQELKEINAYYLSILTLD